MERASQSLKPENIRSGAIESEKDCNVRTKMLFKFADGRMCVRISPISHYVALICPRQRSENLRVHAGIIVAGKAAGRLRERWLHRSTM